MSNKKFYFNNGNYFCPSRWNCMNNQFGGYGSHYMNHWGHPHYMNHWGHVPHYMNHYGDSYWNYDADDDWSYRRFKSKL